MSVGSRIAAEMGVDIEAVMLLRHSNSKVAALLAQGGSIEEYTSVQPIGSPYDYVNPTKGDIKIIVVIVNDSIYGVFRNLGVEKVGTTYDLVSNSHRQFDIQRGKEARPARRFKLQRIQSSIDQLPVVGWERRSRTPVQRSDGSFFSEISVQGELATESDLSVGDEPHQYALVLVENEVTAGGLYDHWQDVTGERYHFPNIYRNKVIPGRPFVYYRGVRRADGSRGNAEYFGCGVIGAVSLDTAGDVASTKAQRRWICEIEDYLPFSTAVPAKREGVFLEEIPKNLWGVVRNMPNSVYEQILVQAGLSPVPKAIEDTLDLPAVDELVISLQSHLLLPQLPKTNVQSSTASKGGRRRSKYSAALGKRGEEVVLRYLRRTLSQSEAATLRWNAAAGETPGWDIEYQSNGELIAIEVKATGGPAFPSFEVTANEWNAAKSRGASYYLMLVAHVTTKTPSIQIIRDPFALFTGGLLNAEAAVWRLVNSTASDESG